MGTEHMPRWRRQPIDAYMRCVCVVCVRVVVVAAASNSNSGGNRVRRQTPRIEDIQYLEVGKICKLTQKAEELHTNGIPQ